jgi:hypothetical protein
MEESGNARIASTMLGYEDHGILSSMLHLELGGGGQQGFGGYTLDDRPAEEYGGDRRPYVGAGLWLAQVLRVVGVSKWEDLKGKHVRYERRNGMIKKIGHIIEDKWFDAEEEFQKLADEEKDE